MEEIGRYSKIVQSLRRPGRRARTFQEIGKCRHCDFGTIVIEKVEVNGMGHQAKTLDDQEHQEHCFCDTCGVAYVPHVIRLLSEHHVKP